MADFQTGAETCKISLEHLVVSESKEVHKNKKTNNPCNNNGSMSKGYRSQMKKLPVATAATI